MAPGLDQLPLDAARVQKHVHQGAEPLRQSGLQSRVGKHETESLRQAAVDCLGIMFEAEVVGQEQPADARRVAAASKILQEQRVIEFPDLRIIEADLLADMNPDPAA